MKRYSRWCEPGDVMQHAINNILQQKKLNEVGATKEGQKLGVKGRGTGKVQTLLSITP